MLTLITILLAFIGVSLWNIDRRLKELKKDRAKKERNFMQYPLHPEEEISIYYEAMQEAYFKAGEANDTVNEMRLKEDKNVKKNKDFSDRFKEQYKISMEKFANLEVAKNEYYLRIEGNIAILNGKKVKDVCKNFARPANSYEITEKKYKEWLAS